MNLTEIAFMIIVLASIIFLVIGLMRRLLWLCILSFVIAIGLFVTQPAVMRDIQEKIVVTVTEFWEPFRQSDYSEIK